MAATKTGSHKPETENNKNNLPGNTKPVQEKRKRGRPKGTKNKTVRKDYQINTEPGENTKYLSHDMKLFNLPTIDINNLQAVNTRIQDYFIICAEDDIKPSIASLALAFHVSRISLFNWINSRNNVIKNTECINAIKAAYDIINSYYEHLMNNGRINPVSGIFLMKNNMGYKDTTDFVINSNHENTLSLDDISNRAGLLTDNMDPG